MPIGDSEFNELVRAGSLEHGATAGAEDAVLVSIAISAKRIADALEKANEPPLEVCEAKPIDHKTPGERSAEALERIVPLLEELAKPAFDEISLSGSRCRICGCSWDRPCPEGCGWYDAEQTLCDNPDCLKKAGVVPAGIGGSHS